MKYFSKDYILLIKKNKKKNKKLKKLVEDFIYKTKKDSNSSIKELLQWSYEQTLNPKLFI